MAYENKMEDIFGGFRIQSEVSIFSDCSPITIQPNDNFRIMIIDDDQRDIQMFEDLLNADARIKFTLSKWTSASQAINYLKNEMPKDPELQPHFVMLDLRMPEMDGEVVLQQLKEATETKDITVVIHSSMSNCQNVMEVAQLGSVAFFQKPIYTDALVDFLQGANANP